LSLSEVFVNVPSDKPTPTKLFVIISSDKGLCGGVHSSLSKATRKALTGHPESPLPADTEVSKDSPIAVIGDKSKAQLVRQLSKNFTMTFNQIGRDIPTFADAAGVADLIIKSGVKFDSVVLVYNKFISQLSYEAAIMEVKGEEALKESSTFLSLSFSVWGLFTDIDNRRRFQRV
jgi:F-type H+-transporting ATPase subunit gamma